MIEFFRDTLDGPLYVVVALLSLIFIMAIIGFMMERIKLKKEEKSRIVYVNNRVDAISPVETKVEQTLPSSSISTTILTDSTNINNDISSDNTINNEIPQQLDNNPSYLVKSPVIVFDDPDKKV